MSVVTDFVRRNPDDINAESLVLAQISALDKANIGFFEEIGRLNRSIKSNKDEIVELLSFLGRKAEANRNGR